MWIRCPKHKHHGATAVQRAAASAVPFSLWCINQRTDYGKTVGPCWKTYQSDLRATQKEKKRRQGQQLLNVRREEALKDAEGVTYEAGAFNE